MASSPVSLALYQPEIPQNVGAAIRLCACLDIGLEIVEPCGFLWDPRRIRQSAMDYFDRLAPKLHKNWEAFLDLHQGTRRIVLLTSRADTPYLDFTFRPGDILLTGQESRGAPESVHQAVDARIGIKMAPGLRSLNVVNAAAMVLGEALRQTR